MLSFESKGEIFFEGYMDFSDDWAGDLRCDNFQEMHDLGLPCAYLSVRGKVTLTDAGIESVNETWPAVCNILEMNPDGDYEGIEELMEGTKCFARI